MPAPAVDALFARARADHQSGLVESAERGYRQVLEADPGFVAAWYLRGVALHSLGRLDEAALALEQAVRLRPDHAEARNHLGIVRAQLGQLDEAIACFEGAIRIKPAMFDAHTNLALGYERQGRLDEAAQHYRAALALQPVNPDNYRSLSALLRKQGKPDEAAAVLREAFRHGSGVPEMYHDLGLLMEQSGRLDEALECQWAAIRLRPDYAESYTRIAVVLDSLGRPDEALARARDAVRIRPEFAGGCNNLGVLLEKRDERHEAERWFRQALRIDPRFVEALYNLATVLGKLGAFDEAEAMARHAIALRPDSESAHHNLGFVLSARGRHAEAADAYRRAIELKPGFVDPLVNLSGILGKLDRLDEAEACSREAIRLDPGRTAASTNLGYVLVEQGRIAEAAECYRAALRLKPDSPALRSGYLYGLNYDPNTDIHTMLAEHQAWARFQEASVVPQPAPTADRGDRPIRVGYVSPDLRLHPVAYFLEPILKHHDRERVQAFCYSDTAVPDAMSSQLQSLAHAWRPTYGLTDAQVADLVRHDGIDILVDLAGHTANHRLGVFARKPAPVQVTYLGYPNTTGLSAIDYLLTDAVTDPPGAPVWSTEALVRLPSGFCCYGPPDDAPEVTPLPAQRTGVVTFGALHKIPKLNPGVLDLWSDLLLAVPSAQLLLYRNHLQGGPREMILAHFDRRGIDRDRLDLRHALDGGGSHLRAYHEIDVSLDVFPWCGHTTACESLWMGVPIITLAGDRHASRMTASVTTSLGMPELIARTREEYIEIARALSADVDRLAETRAGLRERMRGSRLCDGRAFTRELEGAFHDMVCPGTSTAPVGGGGAL